jgi:hypothetical protein
MSKLRVLVDTCVIIEAFRVNCWKALCNHFSVETVECCVIIRLQLMMNIV